MSANYPIDVELDDPFSSMKRKLEEQKQLLDLSESKRQRQDLLLQQMKEKVECPVCMDIPRSGPVPVCPNGHFVCQACKTDTCPTCRVKMGNGKSLLASTLLENIDHQCKFEGCDMALSLEEIQYHEAICPNRDVICPYPKCKKHVKLSKLIDHLEASICGVMGVTALVTDNWNQRVYKFEEVGPSFARISWPVKMYKGFGQVFGTFTRKYDDQYFFGLIMFASEIESSKFKFEMIVHEMNTTVENSDKTIQFQDSPLSIDVIEDKKLILFGSSSGFMSKIMKKSSKSSKFSVSFKVSKKVE